MDAQAVRDEIEGLIKGIGRAFLFAAYLPALLFVAIQQYALLPAFGVQDVALPGVQSVPLLSGEILITLILPAFLALFLVSLNAPIARFFQGRFAWQKRFLLWPWQRANERKRARLYGRLNELRPRYRRSLQTLVGTDREDTANRDALYEHLDQVAGEILDEHSRVEAQGLAQRLPTRARDVCPTELGNALAVTRAYPLDRYGMDAVLFWPRLRQVVDDDLLNALDNLKMFLDFGLNVAALALVVAIEAGIAGILTARAGWWIAGAISVAVAWLAYRSAVRAAWAMGDLTNACFDFYRKDLLARFGLEQPEALFEEYGLWIKLGAFLRRGELAHWPGSLFR